MLSTRVCNITDHLEALWPLLEAHRLELATHLDLMPLGPQVEVYKRLEQEGRLLSILLEHEQAGIVGYCVNIVSNNLHYGTLKTCQNDVIYVSPSYRQEGGGRLLVRATEINAKADGCEMMLMHAKPGTQLVDMLEHYGYSVQDVVYSQVLG